MWMLIPHFSAWLWRSYYKMYVCSESGKRGTSVLPLPWQWWQQVTWVRKSQLDRIWTTQLASGAHGASRCDMAGEAVPGHPWAATLPAPDWESPWKWAFGKIVPQNTLSSRFDLFWEDFLPTTCPRSLESTLWALEVLSYLRPLSCTSRGWTDVSLRKSFLSSFRASLGRGSECHGSPLWLCRYILQSHL